MQTTTKQLWTLLTPSWASGVVCVFLSWAVVVGVVIISGFQTSSLQQLFTATGRQSASSVLGVQTVTTKLASNSIINNLPLFLFWAVIGLVVYFLAVNVWQGLVKAEVMREEFSYVNAPRRGLIKDTLLQILFRLGFLGLWLAYLQLFLKLLLPYVLAAAHLAAGGLTLGNVSYGVLAAVIMFVSLHLHTIFLRLIFLRLRVFSNSLIY